MVVVVVVINKTSLLHYCYYCHFMAIISGVFLKMEVGIRKGAWRRV